MIETDPERIPPLAVDSFAHPWLVEWEPLMDWLRSHGIIPRYCSGYHLEDEGTMAVFTVLHDQEPHVASRCDPSRPDDEICTYEVRTPTRSLPPYRTPSGRILIEGRA